MAYGFNDDKSKVEVFSKDDFIIMEVTVSDVQPNSQKLKTISNDELVNIGIDNIDNYELIGISEREASTTSRRYHTKYDTYGGTSPGYRPIAMPQVTATSTGGLQIQAYNMDVSQEKSIEFRLVLMRIAN